MLRICTDISVKDSLVTVFLHVQIGIMSDRLWANSSQFNIGFCYKLISKAALKAGEAVYKNCSFRFFWMGTSYMLHHLLKVVSFATANKKILGLYPGIINSIITCVFKAGRYHQWRI